MRYYSTHRPVSIGTYPHADDVVSITNYDERRYIDAINRPAYGHIDYAHALTIDEQTHYDLMPAITTDANMVKTVRALYRCGSDEARFTKVWEKAQHLYGYTDDELADAFDQGYVYEKAAHDAWGEFREDHPTPHPDFAFIDEPTPPVRHMPNVGSRPSTDALDGWMNAIYASGEQMGLDMWANYRDALATA